MGVCPTVHQAATAVQWARPLLRTKDIFGLSYSDLQSNYGTVAEPDVRVDMNSKRLGVAGEVRELGTFVQELKFKYNHTDYLHNELENGEVATTFKNKDMTRGSMQLTPSWGRLPAPSECSLPMLISRRSVAKHSCRKSIPTPKRFSFMKKPYSEK